METFTALAVFCCVMANHLGLVSAVEKALAVKLPVVNCPKCFSFWSVLALWVCYGEGVIAALAVAFLAAWLAGWLELAAGAIDVLYGKVYDHLYPEAASASASEGGAA